MRVRAYGLSAHCPTVAPMPSPPRAIAPKPPAAPRTPARLRNASPPADALVDDVVWEDLAFAGLAVTQDDGVEFAEVHGCTFNDTRLADTRWYRASTADTTFSGCDLANAHFDESGFQRTTFTGCRLTGLRLSGCTLENVRFTDCVLDLSTWRFARLKRVVLDGCALIGSDWTAVTAADVLLSGCDLTEGQFSQAKIKELHLQRCRLDGLQGVGSLAGATIESDDLITLSHQLAAALGIRIATDEESER